MPSKVAYKEKKVSSWYRFLLYGAVLISLHYYGFFIVADRWSWSSHNTLRPRQNGHHFADDIQINFVQ